MIKIKNLLFFLCFQVAYSCYANNIPDPTMIPSTNTINNSSKNKDIQSVEIEGIMTSNQKKLNQLIINGQNYKMGDIIESQWKILEISSKKIVLKNLLDHQSKVIYLGENK